MRRIVDSKEMKALDADTIEIHGVPSLVLMERAALAVVEELEQGSYDLSNILVMCGNGNNGGDGIAIARIMHLKGRKVSVCQLGNTDRMSEECKIQTAIADSYHVKYVTNPIYSEYTTIVDAIFGIGLSRPIEGIYKKVIEEINNSYAKIIAVDIPSGICGDNGRIMGCAVKAHTTVTFAYKKIGHCLYPGKLYTGKLVLKDIGIYGEIGEKYYLETSDLKRIPSRSPNGNKGTFGKVLVVAGSKEMAGASILCARAVMRCGAGMVKVITYASNRTILQQAIPEAMIGTYENIDEAIVELDKGLKWADVVVCGCGLGTECISQQIVMHLIKKCRLPLVLDADALNIMSKQMDLFERINTTCIITPHLGEMSRLCGKTIDEIKENLIKSAKTFAEKYHVYCVLKDAVTCIANPDGTIYLNLSGNSGMATAGSGDVLAGIIGALLAVHTSEHDAGALGVFLHGLAGDMAKEKYGESFMTASDIIEQLCQCLQ